MAHTPKTDAVIQSPATTDAIFSDAPEHVRQSFWPDGPSRPSFLAVMSQLYPVFGRSFRGVHTAGGNPGRLFGGGDALDMGVGHYLHAPSESIVAATEALRRGETRYARIPDLYRAVSRKYFDEYGAVVDPERQVVMTGGARAAMALAFTALVQPGAKVIVNDPDYIGLTHMAVAGSAQLVRPRCRQVETGALVPDVEAIVDAIRSGARLFAFTNPCNPTGQTWSRADLAAIVAAAESSGTWILANEVYDKLYFGGPTHCSLATFDSERTVVVSGTAKNYDITGFGLGWIVTNSAVADLLADWQFISHGAAPDTPSQYAGLAALTVPVRDTHPRRSAEFLCANGEVLKTSLAAAGFYASGSPQAGQFAFPYVGGDDIELSLQLMRDFSVRVTPGAVWGRSGDGYLRVALSNPPDLHSSGVERLVKGLTALRPGGIQVATQNC